MSNGGVFVAMVTIFLMLFGAMTAAVLETPSGRILIAATAIVLVVRLVMSLSRERRHTPRAATLAGTKPESVRYLQ